MYGVTYPGRNFMRGVQRFVWAPSQRGREAQRQTDWGRKARAVVLFGAQVYQAIPMQIGGLLACVVSTAKYSNRKKQTNTFLSL